MKTPRDDKNELLFVKAKYFLNKGVTVHISVKPNWFYNGIIKEVSADFLIINDFKEGEMPVFFMEIYPNGICEFHTAGGKNV